MWTRELLKKNAWNALKPNYWMAFLACVIVSLITGGLSSVSSSFSSSNASQNTQMITEISEGNPDAAYLVGFMAGVMVAAIVLSVIGMAFAAFVSNIVQVGLIRFFCNARENIVNLGDLFANFTSGRYMKTVKTMFLQQLYIFLWSLLFVIPGIIKSYEYALVPYLMTCNPDLDTKRALEISKKTMNGEKWNFFVLGLSFIGWYLLGALACGLGVLFVNPYCQATMAEFYVCMRAKMISYGYATEEELTEGYAVA